ncbi:hypothetical protein LAZ67_15002861 [Cordylochernes scorpioides]|uniref:Reverse transcriptase n=1 Tax=Cordylochernes scorpioides TaxID=51811 RepID=A0ABY6L9V1_9ARAC|nr:hypothetical protein LAZ67_15002861 [Cordylochernes scorpioides]
MDRAQDGGEKKHTSGGRRETHQICLIRINPDYCTRDICLLYKPSQDLEADIFTKDLSRDQMKKRLENLNIVGIKTKNPVWVADENVDLKEEWRNRWSNLAIANKDLVEDPNTKPPGYNLPRRTWSTLNRIRTSTGRCNYLLNKWNMSPDQNCDCGQIQTMHHILRDCPRRFFQGTLGDIHRCTEEALEWIRHLDIPL